MNHGKNYKLLSIVLAGAILINCAIALVLFKKLYYTYPQPKKNNNSISYFLNRQQYFEVFPKDSNSIIFLGNSLTQNFEVTELLKDLRIKNRGIYGDFTAGVVNRITPIIQTHPKKVFRGIGLNDLLHNIPRYGYTELPKTNWYPSGRWQYNKSICAKPASNFQHWWSCQPA